MVLLLGDWVPENYQSSIEINTHDDLVLLNLEGPVLADASVYTRITKSGPHLHSTHLPRIEDSEAVCFALANNHIKDYGWLAVQESLEHLRERQYYWVGVGENEYLARKPLLLAAGDFRYAIFSFSEVQAGRATPAQPGSATAGPWVYQAIEQASLEVDKVIVSVHAANEFLPWPSPLMQDLYRSYIDAGANIVHGHHSHVPQGTERYKDGLICYGLGNFVGSPMRYSRFEVQLSIGVRIWYSSAGINYQVEPYRFHQIGDRVVVREEESDQAKAYLAVIQEPLTNRHLLEALWQEAALWLYDKYGRDSVGLPFTTENRYFNGPGQYLKSLARRLRRHFAFTHGATRQNQVIWYNLFACLSHQHMMETALGLLCGEIADVRSPEARKLAATYLSRLLLS